MGSLNDSVYAGERDMYGTRCSGNAGLAKGTGAATIKTVASVDFSIKGKFYTKAITDNIAMTPAATQAANSTCYYLVEIDSAGAVTINKGTDGGDIPSKSSDAKCAIGVMKVVNAQAGNATFVVGTTDVNAAGVTTTFSNIAVPPLNAAAIGM